MLPLAGTEAKELLFVEIDSDDEYGYLKGTTSYTFDEVTNTPSANRRSLSGVMQLPATTIGGISCPAGAYPIVGLNGSATAHNSTAELVNYPITYPLGFRKVNTETGEYVAGATYGLYDANKQLIKQTSETDSNGYYKFTELKPNRTYYVREITAPAGFTLNETYYTVTNDYTPVGGVSANEIDLVNDLEVSETPYSVEISVSKYDQFNGYGIEGITFDIYRNNESAPVGSITTDTDGKATSDALYLGKLVGDVFENKYRVVERDNDDYFMVDADGNIIDSFTVSVTSADITSHTDPVIKYQQDVPNIMQTVDLTVHKVDRFDRPIANCVFEIYPAQNIVVRGKVLQNATDLLGTVTTDANGNGKPIDAEGNTPIIYTDFMYKLVEISCPDEYVMLTEPVYFTAEGTEHTVAVIPHDSTIPNDEKEGTVKITKHTEGDVNREGIRFTLTGISATNRDITLEARTDANGEAVIYSVPIGDYTVEEDGETVGYAYVVAAAQPVNVVYNETSNLDFYNVEKEGTVEVTKRSEGDKNVSNIKFTLSGTSDTGREISIDAVTNSEGKATFKNVPIGTYTITEDEQTVPYAYLTAEKQTVTVDYAQTSNVTFFNSEKEGTIEVQKRTEGMVNLGNIRFTLSGTSDSGRDISSTAVTDENGKATFKNVPIGTYTVTEDGQTVPYAYLTAEKQSVEVEYAATTNVTFFNVEKTGSLDIQKRTEGDKNVQGIRFILSGTSDTGREIYQEKETDENGKVTFDEVPIGTYRITEDGETVPVGYLVADPQEGKVFPSTTTELTFINDETEVEFSKVTIVDGVEQELEGATLQVVDENGAIIEEWVSEKEPHYIKGVLKAGGTYTLRETISPDGYVISTDVEFTVNDDGSITSVKMVDDITKVTVSKKAITGDDELAGAKLKVVDENGETVEEWISTTEPHYINAKLKAGGTYKLIEEVAPDGYVVANDITFTVSEDGSVDTVVMKDDTTKVRISKRDITNDE